MHTIMSETHSSQPNTDFKKNTEPGGRIMVVAVAFSFFVALLLFFSDSPSATASGRNTSVSVGSSVSFTCPVDGNPEPTITWYKGSNAGGTVLFSGKTLNFPQTKADDTGCYTCSAINSLGTDTITQCLVVGIYIFYLM